jgi:hypothetical protein
MTLKAFTSKLPNFNMYFIGIKKDAEQKLPVERGAIPNI